jgi:hypothetical protein
MSDTLGMKRTLKWAIIAGGASAVIGAAFVAGRAWAVGVPATGALTYSGRLEDAAGAPLTGSRNLQISFWDAKPAGTGTKLCETPSAPVSLEAGRFSITLPDKCASAVKDKSDLWVEILVDGSALPRTKLGAVPYALEAARASSAGGALDTRIAAVEQLASGLPARIGVLARSVERTGAVPPGAGWTTIPGLTSTFTLTQPSLVQVTGNGMQRTINQGADTSCNVAYRYVVDGKAKGHSDWGQRIQVSNGAVSWHSIWSIIDSNTLGTGQHTIELQARSPAGCYVCAELDGTLTSYVSCTMNVLAIPNR